MSEDDETKKPRDGEPHAEQEGEHGDEHEDTADEELDEERLPDNVVRVDFGRRREPAPASEKPADIVEALDPLAREKLQIFSEFIDEGKVMLTLDTRMPGVEVPAQFHGMIELRLNFSHRFGIDDFDYDLQGVRATLSFGGQPFYCVVPWGAVTMMFSHETGAAVLFEQPD